MTGPDLPFEDPNVEAVYAAFPKPARAGLASLRRLVFETAMDTPGVGDLQETLKWGQPAYLTPETKSGTTLRLGVPKTGGFAIFAHCQTRVIPEFRALFGDKFTFDGNRAVLFEDGQTVPEEPIRMLIASALTYHLK